MASRAKVALWKAMIILSGYVRTNSTESELAALTINEIIEE